VQLRRIQLLSIKPLPQQGDQVRALATVVSTQPAAAAGAATSQQAISEFEVYAGSGVQDNLRLARAAFSGGGHQ
jgi:hypothetical protein